MSDEGGTGSTHASGVPGGRVWGAWRHIWQPHDDLGLVGAEESLAEDVFRNGDGTQWSRLCRLLHREYPSLLAVQPTFKRWDKGEADELLQMVRSKVPAGKTFLGQWRVLEVVDAGNRAGRWVIPIVQLPAPMPPPHKPYFDDARFRQMVASQLLLDSFADDAMMSELSPRARWGQVLGSCAVHAGIYQPSLLAQVPEAVERAPEHLHWLELRVGGSGDHSGMRRHYLDPFTRLLLARLHCDETLPEYPSKRRNTRAALACIRAYAEATGLADSDLPTTLQALREVARTRHASTVPPYLMGWADGHYRATALPSRALARLFTPLPDIPAEPRPTSVGQRQSPVDGEQDKDESDAGDADSQEGPVLPSVSSLGSIIRAGGVSVATRLQTFQDTSAPPGVLRLAEWAQVWLFGRGAGRRPLAPKTAYDRFNAIAERLVGQLANDDPAALASPDDFIELYTTALDDASSAGARRRVVKGLQSFHAFLQSVHGAPDLDASGLFSIRGRTPHAVDANLIDPEAFEWAVAWIEHVMRDTPEGAEVAVLIASLGYYCGLRRSEAEGLRVGDLDGEPIWDLVVQPNSDRRLKSVSAHRRVPLPVLLPPQRLERLRRWWWKRIGGDDVAAVGHRPLFGPEGSLGCESSKPNRTRGALEAIRDALYRATGDPHLRFHHLRHSFANRLLLTLWAYEQPEGEALPTWAEPLVCHDREALRETLLGRAPIQRRSLRLLSAMMGHSGVDITMTHYIHIADLLYCRALRRRPPPVSDAALAALAGVSAERLARRRRQVGMAEPDFIDSLADRLIPRACQLTAREPVTERRLSEPLTRYERYREMTRCVNEVAVGHLSEGPFTSPWPPANVDHWLKALHAVDQHHRKSRHGDLPEAVLEPPRTQQDHRAARRTLEWLDELKPSQRSRVLLAYANGKLPSNPLNVAMSRVDEFRLWVRLLRQLDLLSDVDFYHLPNTWAAALGSRAQVEAWREATGEEIFVAGANEQAMLPRSQIGSRGAILTLHRIEASPTRNFWVHGLTWAMTASRVFESRNGNGA